MRLCRRPFYSEPDGLAPARGVLVGLAIALVIDAVIAYIAWRLL